MEKCSVCGEIKNCPIICDNSCGAVICSENCMSKDNHDCGEECPKCDHMMVMINNKWCCNYCIKNNKKDT